MAKVKVSPAGKSGQIVFRVEPELQVIADALLATTGQSMNSVLNDLYRNWVFSEVSKLVGSVVETSESAVKTMYEYRKAERERQSEEDEKTLGECLRMWDMVHADEDARQRSLEQKTLDMMEKERMATTRRAIEDDLCAMTASKVPVQALLSAWDVYEDQPEYLIAEVDKMVPGFRSQMITAINEYTKCGGSIEDLIWGIRSSINLYDST